MPADSSETRIVAAIRVGTAGWSIPAEHATRFPGEGMHLERYSRRLSAVEINSSFYHPHRASTYARWAASTPETFRFAVKAPREITHQRKLDAASSEILGRFLGECTTLGPKLGPILFQLPPSFAFDHERAASFFELLRARHSGPVACEPRHPSWFEAEADQLMASHQIARVAADPAVAPAAHQPGGWPGLVYHRLHGSPRIYYSAYPAQFLGELANDLATAAARTAETWCVFDNTAAGAATVDALSVVANLAR